MSMRRDEIGQAVDLTVAAIRGVVGLWLVRLAERVLPRAHCAASAPH